MVDIYLSSSGIMTSLFTKLRARISALFVDVSSWWRSACGVVQNVDAVSCSTFIVSVAQNVAVVYGSTEHCCRVPETIAVVAYNRTLP